LGKNHIRWGVVLFERAKMYAKRRELSRALEFHKKAGLIFDKLKKVYPKSYDAWKIDYYAL